MKTFILALSMGVAMAASAQTNYSSTAKTTDTQSEAAPNTAMTFQCDPNGFGRVKDKLAFFLGLQINGLKGEASKGQVIIDYTFDVKASTLTLNIISPDPVSDAYTPFQKRVQKWVNDALAAN